MFEIGQVIVCNGHWTKEHPTLVKALEGQRATVKARFGDNLVLNWHNRSEVVEILQDYYQDGSLFDASNSQGWNVSSFKIQELEIRNRFELMTDEIREEKEELHEDCFPRY